MDIKGITMEKPIIDIPIGDSAGIGSEIAVKAAADARVHETARPLLIGDAQAVKRVLAACGLSLAVRTVLSPPEKGYDPEAITLLDVRNLDIRALAVRKVQAMCSRAAYEYIEAAARVPYVGHT